MGGASLLLLLSGGEAIVLPDTDLDHSPADVVRYLLIDLGLGTLPVSAGAWPVSCSAEPNLPDDAVTTYDTAGRTDGRIMFTGEVEEYHGVQVRVRAKNHTDGWRKVRRIAITLDQLVRDQWVSAGTSAYVVHSVHRGSMISGVGKEPNSKRQLFTLNLFVRMSKVL